MSGVTRCQTCARLDVQLTNVLRDLGYAKGLLRRNGNKYGGRYISELATAKTAVKTAEGNLADHIDAEHDGVRPERDRAVMENVHVAASPDIPDGKAKCPSCSKVVAVINETRLRRHMASAGYQCPNVQMADAPPFEYVMPEVKIPRLTPGSGHARAKRDEYEPSRLEVGSHCRECGKWLPGERSLCGRCSVLRSA